jgi:hypothetical protein
LVGSRRRARGRAIAEKGLWVLIFGFLGSWISPANYNVIIMVESRRRGGRWVHNVEDTEMEGEEARYSNDRVKKSTAAQPAAHLL